MKLKGQWRHSRGFILYNLKLLERRIVCIYLLICHLFTHPNVIHGFLRGGEGGVAGVGSKAVDNFISCGSD